MENGLGRVAPDRIVSTDRHTWKLHMHTFIYTQTLCVNFWAVLATRGPWWPWIAHPSHFRNKMNSTFFILIVSNCDPLPPRHHMKKLIKVHKEKLHTKNQSSIPSSFREEEFWSWISLFLCFNLGPLGWGQFWPQGNHINKIDKGLEEILNTKYQSSKPSSFREKEFWSWSFLLLCYNLGPPGMGQFWPPGHDMNKLDRGSYGNAHYQILKLYFFQFQITRGPWWPWVAHLSQFPHKMNSTFSITIVPTYDPPNGASFDPRGIIWIELI